MNVLLAGPDYFMEMGWRLMRWQNLLRAMAPSYDKVLVITNEFGIYEDFAEDASTAYIGEKSMWNAVDAKITRIEPCKEFCCNAQAPQKFHRYRRHMPSQEIITIHARSRKLAKERNWSKEKWQELVRLLNKEGYVVASIGTDVHNIGVDLDFCNVEFKQLCKVIAMSKMLIGPSSGPMHLASIIGTPHLVWTYKKKHNLGGIAGSNRERYEHVWNPFGCKVTVLDESMWNPSVKEVMDGIEQT